jgi:hypothetical protein
VTDHRPPRARQLTSQPPERTVDRNRAGVTLHRSPSPSETTDPHPAQAGHITPVQRWVRTSQIGLSGDGHPACGAIGETPSPVPLDRRERTGRA